MSKNQIKNWTLCNLPDLHGNIVDWTVAKWEITNMKKVNIDINEMCKSMQPGPLIIPEILEAQNLMHLCNQLGGRLFVIKDENSRKTMVEIGQHQKICKGMSKPTCQTITTL